MLSSRFGQGPSRSAAQIAIPASDFTVNFSDVHQTIDGFGASTAFANPYSTSAADFLWSTAGIGLSMARDKISPNGWPQILPFTGADESDGDFSVLAQCQARGAFIWANVWFWPTAWTGGSDPGTLDPTHYGDAATLITTYLDRALAAGVIVKAISFLNEPDGTPTGGFSEWTTSQSISFIKNNLYAALVAWGTANPTWQAAAGMSFPYIVAPNTANWANLSTWTAAYESDGTVVTEIARYGTHQYFGGGASVPGTLSHPIWQSEYYDQTDSTWETTILSALDFGKRIHDAMTTGNASAWHAWYAQLTATNDNQGLIGLNDSANYTVLTQSVAAANWQTPTLPKRAFALGNWSKFVRPGWARVGTTGSKSGVYGVTAFRNVSTGDYAIVVVNNSGSQLITSFTLSGGISGATVPHVTTDTALGAIGTDGNLSAGSTTYSVPASLTLLGNRYFSCIVPPGVTTFTGNAS